MARKKNRKNAGDAEKTAPAASQDDGMEEVKKHAEETAKATAEAKPKAAPEGDNGKGAKAPGGGDGIIALPEGELIPIKHAMEAIKGGVATLGEVRESYLRQEAQISKAVQQAREDLNRFVTIAKERYKVPGEWRFSIEDLSFNATQPGPMVAGGPAPPSTQRGR